MLDPQYAKLIIKKPEQRVLLFEKVKLLGKVEKFQYIEKYQLGLFTWSGIPSRLQVEKCIWNLYVNV